MKLTNAHSSGSLHRRVRRMLIQCIAIVVLLSTSVGLGIGLYQDVYARDQLLSNAAQMAADAPLLTDTIQTDTAQQYLERTVRRVAAVDMLGIYDVQGRPLVRPLGRSIYQQTQRFSLIRRLLLGNDIVLRLEQTLKAALLVLRRGIVFIGCCGRARF